jgi:hypothetical protein
MSRLFPTLCFAALTILTATASAGEKKLMHCFAFTAVDSAADADWQAFFKATDALPSKIPGVTHVWYGKLQRPMNVYFPDEATGKKLRDGAKTATGPVERVTRQWAVCMEMADANALTSYGSAPYHKDWDAAYTKVRVEGTTTMNFMGQ